MFDKLLMIIVINMLVISCTVNAKEMIPASHRTPKLYPGDTPEIQALNTLLAIAAQNRKLLYTTQKGREARKVIQNNIEPLIPLFIKAFSKERDEIQPLERDVLGAIPIDKTTAEKIYLGAIKDYPIGPSDDKTDANKWPLIDMLVVLDTKASIERLFIEFEKLPDEGKLRIANTILFYSNTYDNQNGALKLLEIQKNSKENWASNPVIIQGIKSFQEKQKNKITNEKTKEDPFATPDNVLPDESRPDGQKDASISPSENNEDPTEHENLNRNTIILLVAIIVGILVLIGGIYFLAKRRA